jgi:hypothetical protein
LVGVKMKKAHWTRGEKWTAAGTIAAIIGLVLIVFVPEIRTKLGLERHLPLSPKIAEQEPLAESKPVSPVESSQPKTKAKANQSTKTKVSGENNVAGNNVAGNGNAVGNANQVASPTVVIPGSGNGVSFGQQGGITAGTVVVGPPPAHVKWEADDKGDWPKGKHPRSFAKIFVDQSVPDARFGVLCDRPCAAVWNSSVEGMNFSKTFSANGVPNAAGFMIVQPNPFPSFTNYILGVESLDDLPVRILHVGLWNLTEEQKRSLLQ